MPMRASRRPAALLAALALGASMGGCIVSHDQATVPASTSVAMPDARAVGVDVKTSNGRITITQNADTGDATISAQAKLTTLERAERFAIDATIDRDGTLVVRPIWPDGKRLSSESCSFEISAHTLLGVVASSSNGAITITGGTGSSRLQTSNGAIHVEGREGDLQASTSNGRIEVERCVGTLDLRSSNGTISISASMPARGEPHAWRVTTSNGPISLDLAHPLTTRLRATTSNGRATLQRSANADTQTIVSGRTIQVGEGPGEIILKTSNGSITVRTAEHPKEP